MTDTFLKEREQAFEAKYAHDAELDFLTKTRGGAMFAEWVSGLLKLDADEALRYSHQLLENIILGRDHQDILQQVSVDLSNAGQGVSLRSLQARVDECQIAARKSLY